MKKGQGALEYLIITAAVLAIAAVVILFLTGAFSSTSDSASISACQGATTDCAHKRATLGEANAVSHCNTVCTTGCIDQRSGEHIAEDPVTGETAKDFCVVGDLGGLNALFGTQ